MMGFCLGFVCGVIATVGFLAYLVNDKRSAVSNLPSSPKKRVSKPNEYDELGIGATSIPSSWTNNRAHSENTANEYSNKSGTLR